jgi:hypothetical protein
MFKHAVRIGTLWASVDLDCSRYCMIEYKLYYLRVRYAEPLSVSQERTFVVISLNLAEYPTTRKMECHSGAALPIFIRNMEGNAMVRGIHRLSNTVCALESGTVSRSDRTVISVVTVIALIDRDEVPELALILPAKGSGGARAPVSLGANLGWFSNSTDRDFGGRSESLWQSLHNGLQRHFATLAAQSTMIYNLQVTNCRSNLF